MTHRSLLARVPVRGVFAAGIVLAVVGSTRIPLDDARVTGSALAVCAGPILDADGDGVQDCEDVCPNEPLRPDSGCTCWQVEHKGCPDPTGCGSDGDFDSVPDACDNCPFIVNGNQADQDADGIGDPCENLALIYTSLPVVHDPNPSAGSQFGAALATTVVPNGPLLLVGAPLADAFVGAEDSGAVYLFDQDAVLQFTLSKDLPMAGDRLGSALAFRNETPIVGAPFDDAAAAGGGAVYAFTGGPLVPLDAPIPPPGAQIGAAVAAGNVVVAGAPGDSSDGPDAGRVVITAVGPGAPAAFSVGPADAVAGAQVGAAVAAITPAIFAVGATFARAGDADGAGAVYLIEGASGAFVQRLNAPNPQPGDLFGFALAFVAGNVLVGAPFDDGAGPDAGAVYLFRVDGVLRGVIPAPAGGHFGTAIASLDRPTTASGYAAISAPDVDGGIVYVVDADPARPTFGRVVQILRDPRPDPENRDRFGAALAAADPPIGNPAGDPALADVIVGAPHESRDGTDAGLVYRFRFCGDACVAGCGNGVLEDGEECDDGDFDSGDGCDANCTRTRCGNGVITAGEACDDGNAENGDGCSIFCENEGCTGAGGFTIAAPVSSLVEPAGAVQFCGCSADNGKACDDGDGCTVNDTCFASACRGTPVVCDDGVACTIDRCVSDGPFANHCTFIPQDSLCADAAFCTLDVCNPNTGCTNTPIPDCCTTAADCDDGDTCDGAERCIPCVGCEFHVSPCCARGAVCANGAPPPDDTLCDDHDVCTTGDRCQSEHCGGTAVDCDEGDSCKTYSCDAPTVGCTFTYKPGCTPCPNGDADCLDDNACNGAEHCVAGYCGPGTAPDCDDQDPCTDDVCDRELGCVSGPTESATVRCLIEAVLASPECAGQPLSLKIRQRLDAAAANVEAAQTSTDPKIRKKLLKKAKKGLGAARTQIASPASRGVSADCRKALRQAIKDARQLTAGLG